MNAERGTLNAERGQIRTRLFCSSFIVLTSALLLSGCRSPMYADMMPVNNRSATVKIYGGSPTINITNKQEGGGFAGASATVPVSPVLK